MAPISIRGFKHTTQVEDLPRPFAHCSPLTADSLSAFCFLPTAHCFLSKSSFTTNALSFAIPSAIAIAFAYPAAEPASMGRGDFVSWIAVRSNACDRADRIWCDLVCD